MSSERILIIDDDRAHAEALGEALAREGYACVVAGSGRDGLRKIESELPGVVLTDLVMHDVGGLEILRSVKERDPDVEVVVITGHGSIETAVEAMKEGAATYLSKPVNVQELRVVVRKRIEERRERLRSRELERQLDRKFGFEGIIGSSRAMRRIFSVLQPISRTDATVLITGESGTGKELIARAIHNNSPRKKKPFVALNCAALSEGLLESELFGHEKGAFTGAIRSRPGIFEHADGGTLFLDEVGDMPLVTQVRFLRVIEQQEVVRVGSNRTVRVNVRLVAATNQDLERLVENGVFREDLYFRLKVVTIDLPPLRERPGDLPLLVDAFFREIAAVQGKEVDGISREALSKLQGYAWRGNVRELRNCIENMITICRGRVLGVEDIPAYILDRSERDHAAKNLTPTTLKELEKEVIRDTLAHVDGNRERAAKLLGIGERTLYRKLKLYGID